MDDENSTQQEIEEIRRHYESQYKFLEEELKYADSAHKAEKEQMKRKHKRTVYDILARQDIELRSNRDAYAKKQEELQHLKEEHENVKRQLEECKEKEQTLLKQIKDTEEKLREFTLKRMARRKHDIEIFLKDLEDAVRLHRNDKVSPEMISNYLSVISERIASIKERGTSRSLPKRLSVTGTA